MARVRARRRSTVLVSLCAAGVIAALPLGCGKSSRQGPRPSPAGGTSGAGGPGGTTGGNGADGGSVTTGGTAGASPSSGGSSGAGSGGESGEPGEDGGATTGGDGGTGAVSGTTNAGGYGGSSATAGVSGTSGTSGTGGAAGSCTGCGPHETCWSDATGSRCVARTVPLPTGLGIDATEVTREQYFGWLVREPATTGQAEICEWNATFMPDPTCMTATSVCVGETCAAHPQPCVDFCDAAAYCVALGRRLCTKEEWTDACSSDGEYPLGRETPGTFGESTCNDYTEGGSTTVPVASLPGCQPPPDSGFAGVFDMVGNVEEWVDDCAGPSGTCQPRGLPFGAGAAAPSCDQSTYAARSAVSDKRGFRCCSP